MLCHSILILLWNSSLPLSALFVFLFCYQLVPSDYLIWKFVHSLVVHPSFSYFQKKIKIPLFLYFAFGLFNIVALFLIVHNAYLFFFYIYIYTFGFFIWLFLFFFVVLIFLLLLFSLFLWLFLYPLFLLEFCVLNLLLIFLFFFSPFSVWLLIRS
jgi:hypothetical protein